jgi:hypothetical protein
MSDCCNPSDYHELFGPKQARRDLRSYRKKGLDKVAGRMIDYLKGRGVDGDTVLEVGGGIGAIQVELLKAGAAGAVNVELSSGYETVANQLLEQESLGGRVERRIGDFTELAADLQADHVVMNRVICCYPNMERLMGAALASSRRCVAASYPRDRLLTRLPIRIGNAYFRLRKVDFQAYVHTPTDIKEVAQKAGFDVVFQAHDIAWHGVVYEKAS